MLKLTAPVSDRKWDEKDIRLSVFDLLLHMQKTEAHLPLSTLFDQGVMLIEDLVTGCKIFDFGN